MAGMVRKTGLLQRRPNPNRESPRGRDSGKFTEKSTEKNMCRRRILWIYTSFIQGGSFEMSKDDFILDCEIAYPFRAAEYIFATDKKTGKECKFVVLNDHGEIKKRVK